LPKWTMLGDEVGFYEAAVHDWQFGVATRLWTPILSAFGSGRPIPVVQDAQIVAGYRTFVACGRLLGSQQRAHAMVDPDESGDSGIPSEATAVSARRVFISYASQDASVAQKLCSALEAAGFPCWMAPRDVNPGAQYADAIVLAINEAQAVVLVLSAGAVTSSHVGREVERAASKHKQIIALRIDSAPLNRALEYFLGESQWIDVPTLGMSAALIKLTEAVGRGSATSLQETPIAQSGGDLQKRVAIIAAVLVSVGAAAAAGMYFWPLQHHAERPAAVAAITDKSIAVLPFADMSQGKDQEYFADGMAEEILDLLAKIPSLKVIGRTSSFHFKGKNDDVRTIGHTLNAAYVVEGSVRKSGDRVRVTAQLINTQSGIHQWSETYDRPIGDVLKMQDEIAAGLVRALQLTLEADVLRPRPSLGSTDAYNYYLQGLYALNRYDREGFDAAAAYFQQSLNLDPKFAPAAASLAVAYSLQGDFGYSPSGVTWQQARRAAEAAVKLDPTLAAPHTTLSMVYGYYDWDWPTAEAESKQALDLAPRDSWALLVASILSSTLGRLDDALTQMNASLAIDPLEAGAWQNLAYLQLRRGRFLEAEAAARRALEIAPTYDGVHYLLGLTLLARGNADAALAEMQQESPGPEGDRDAGVAIVYHAMNRKADSDAALARYTKTHSDDDPVGIAGIHAIRGETDAAFAWLERAYSQKAYGLYWIKGDTALANLVNDPRYNAFLRKMKLPEEPPPT
jgi:TolB-like protein/Tfp pilus assembly protein PilF